MVSHFGTKLLGLSVVGAIALINSGTANAAQNLRYATWDPPHHEWIKFGVDKWIKSIGQVTSGRVNVKKLAKGLGAPPAYHDFIKKGDQVFFMPISLLKCPHFQLIILRALYASFLAESIELALDVIDRTLPPEEKIFPFIFVVPA